MVMTKLLRCAGFAVPFLLLLLLLRCWKGLVETVTGAVSAAGEARRAAWGQHLQRQLLQLHVAAAAAAVAIYACGMEAAGTAAAAVRAVGVRAAPSMVPAAAAVVAAVPAAVRYRIVHQGSMHLV